MRPTKAKAIARTRATMALPLTLLVLLTALVLAGCNTMSGVGEDVSAAGETLDETSERTQEKITGDRPAPGNQAGQY